MIYSRELRELIERTRRNLLRMKTVFFDVDTQLDFLYPAGALYVPGAERIVPAIARLNRFAARARHPGDLHHRRARRKRSRIPVLAAALRRRHHRPAQSRSHAARNAAW